jgi:Carbohydrate binding module (family 6)
MGIISISNTVGFQNWQVIKKKVKLDDGQHVLKLVVDGDLFTIDKIVFEETKG